MCMTAADDTDDDAFEVAWIAIKAARHGAALPERLRLHPLCRMLKPVASPGPIVIGQIGQSLDGRVATVTGASRYINGDVALDHLHRLRALVDAVVVGVGTVCADDCQLTVRRVAGSAPARVVIDPKGRIPNNARVLDDDGQRRIVIRGEGAAHCGVAGVETVHLPSRDGRIAPADVVAALARRGLRRVLVEGGADTVSAFVAAGRIDRLHVMVAPLLVGSGRPGLALPPIDELDRARRPAATAHPLGTDVLFDCDMRASTPHASDIAQGDRHERDDAGRRRLHVDG
ncbi:RibD family protein [Methylopila henanensis]|uniref:RibD family protein n=1 Tax=Methylopila henanensis TaxID=873516 RepID=A0ABW4K831_9HYPH